MAHADKLVVWFKDVDKNDGALVGGKGANLGEMVRAGFPVPNGFIVTSGAYYLFLRQNNLPVKIKHLLSTLHVDNQDSLNQVSAHIRHLIREGEIPTEIVKEVFTHYKTLGGLLRDALVAVRSSATAEDLPGASFAGQQETYLNVKGEANLLLRLKDAWASLFDARAIFYRKQKHFDDFKVGIAVPVQKMVESDTSGVMFTIDPLTNDKSKIIIEAIYGLGEYIVQGKVTPDHYEVTKDDMSIAARAIATQTIMYKKSGMQNKEVGVNRSLGEKQKISDKHIQELAQLGKNLEKHYYFPQDIEWAIEKNKIYIVQTRPVTTIPTDKQINNAKTTKNSEELTTKWQQDHLILKGDPASPGIASGQVRILKSAKEIEKLVKGEILVADQTNPDYVPAMKKASAIITNSGGRTSHAAIVSRELGIPAVVGTKTATTTLKTGLVVTVNGLKGEIYKGGHIHVQANELVARNTPLTALKTVTKVYVNLAEPEAAQRISAMHVDGVGLLRAEFMMAQIGTHPKKLIHDGKKKIFVEKLVEGLESFCKAFSPRPVVYRTSDFKTNEYRGLIGGKDFEPVEPNPMLGFRGVYRYIHDPQVFQLELDAIKIVRNKLGYKNLWIMLPFVRTLKELIDVKRIMIRNGLPRTNSLKLWMMVEIPSNVILLDQFISLGIDGVSIGSNDLTMLILGTDRDNSEVAPEFDEQNEAVLWALEHVIKTAHKHKITASICGQAPSMYPNLVEKLVKWGITSVSVAPDTIDHTRQIIHEIEERIIK